MDLRRKSWGNLSLVGCIVLVIMTSAYANGSPVVTGPNVVFASLGENVTLQCRADQGVTWYRISASKDLFASPDDQSLLEESIRKAQNLHLYGDTEFPEDFTAVIELMDISFGDQGLYICVHEFEKRKVLKKLKKMKTTHFSTVLLIVNESVPIIEGGDTLTIDAGGDVNITCTGDKPVSWILRNNLTLGVQLVDEIKSDKKHSSVLVLKNVNYTDVGYYFCKFQQGPIIYEDHDHQNDHMLGAVYLFVKDLEHLLASEGGFYYVMVNETLVIPCKPTFPEVEVKLSTFMTAELDVKNGIVMQESEPNLVKGKCSASYQNHSDSMNYSVYYYRLNIPRPSLEVSTYWQRNSLELHSDTYTVVEGKDLIIHCTGKPKRGEQIYWMTPPGVNETGNHIIDRYLLRLNEFMQSITIQGLELKDAGIYGCYIGSQKVNSTVSKAYIDVISSNSPLFRMKPQKDTISIDKEDADDVMWVVYFSAYPTIHLQWFFEGETLAELKMEGDQKPTKDTNKDGYEIDVSWLDGKIQIRIKNPTFLDVGIHKLVGITGSLTQEVLLKFRMSGGPSMVQVKINPTNYLVKDRKDLLIDCIGYGYPLPKLELVFVACHSGICESEYLKAEKNEEFIVEDSFNSTLTATRKITWHGNALVQGMYKCKAQNTHGANISEPLIFSITDSSSERTYRLQIEASIDEAISFASEITAIEGDHLELTCRGNNLLTSSPLSWSIFGDKNVSYSNYSGCQTFKRREICFTELPSKYSWVYSVEMKASSEFDGVLLICSEGSDLNESASLQINVQKAAAPVWSSEPLGGRHYERKEKENVELFCSAEGSPKPKITWFKDDHLLLEHDADSGILVDGGNLTRSFLFQKDSGKYSCRAENRMGGIEDWITLEVEDPDTKVQTLILICVGTLLVILFFISVFFIVKIPIDRRRNLRLKQSIFEQGSPECLNPELDLGQQADLLPYDKKFEFPRRGIIFDKLLGSGEFGYVYKAIALNLVAGESKTTVAVKTIKSHSTHDHMKTLRTELKIMIHIGRHINIVNLLGACSKDLASKGELLLIVEYCRFGNILEYMQKHKNSFLNQINDIGKIDPLAKFNRRNKILKATISPINYAQLEVHSSESPFYSNMDQGRNSISANGELSPCIVMNGRIDSPRNFFSFIPEPQTPMEGDNYVNKAELERRAPLSTQMLLQWAYQIANGMFYLSERKVIHGDLAARNILLADKNIVKISDFGLAKNIYKNAQYKKRKNSPVPVKWSSIEVLREGIYSTQSDVWSFGIVLWEIFTLGKNPYPGIEEYDSLIKKLEDGLRLSKPEFATNEIYFLMELCWRANPNQRPSFNALEKGLGDLLGESEKQEYLRLNEPYGQGHTVNELLDQIQTPSYSARVKEFFGEKDSFGYEKPISVEQNGIPEESMESFIGSSFVLQPVPKKRRSHSLTADYSHDVEGEGRPFLEKKDSLPDYIPMSSPTKKQSVFTFQHDHLDSPTVSEYLCMHTTRQGEDSFSKSMESRMSGTSPSYRNVELRTSADIEGANDDQHKRDSGLYTPCSTLVVNPEYMYDTGKQFEVNALENEDKTRTRFDSSSGVSVLSSESSNSIELKNNKVPLQIVQIEEESDMSSILNSLPPLAV